MRMSAAGFFKGLACSVIVMLLLFVVLLVGLGWADREKEQAFNRLLAEHIERGENSVAVADLVLFAWDKVCLIKMLDTVEEGGTAILDEMIGRPYEGNIPPGSCDTSPRHNSLLFSNATQAQMVRVAWCNIEQDCTQTFGEPGFYQNGCCGRNAILKINRDNRGHTSIQMTDKP